MKSFLFLVAVLMSASTFAAVDFTNNANLHVGPASRVYCGAGIACTKKANGSVIVATESLGTLQTVATAAAGSLTKASCGKTLINSAATAVNLPEASTVIGCRITFVTANASNYDVNPDDADQILVQTNAVGDSIRNATLGNTITLVAINTSQWVVTGILGTWSDIN